MTEITIAGRKIGPEHRPFIIAEMSGNHNQSLERALEIVDAAAAAGVDAVKIQTYTADTITIDVAEGEFFIADPNSLWQGTSLYKLYEQAYTPWEWHQAIFDRCEQHGLIGFSSPFDATAVDFLETCRVPAYKIASFEIVDIPLIQKAASTGKPLIMSTGMATEAEIEEAVNAAREAGCQELVLLKCTSSYPADPINSHLNTIACLRERFSTLVGLSDHTLGIGAAVASVALGGCVIEKHFTLRRADGGVDSAFSLEPHEMKQLVDECATAHRALGSVQFGPTDGEKSNMKFRRSLYAVEDIPAGARLTVENVRSIRPGLGLPPKFYAQILGQKTTQAIKRGTPLSWDLITAPVAPASN